MCARSLFFGVLITPMSTLTLRTIREGPHVVWVDNFNKNLSWKIPDVHKGVFTACNWTGVAVREYTAGPCDMRLVHHDFGFTSGMPELDELFEKADDIKEWFLSKTSGVNYMMKHDSSMVVQWQAHSVPIKPEANQVPEKFKAAVASKNCALDTLHPAEIMEHNIGSWLGMARVFREFYDQTMATPPADRRYTIINCDSNIFRQCIKVRSSCAVVFSHLVTLIIINAFV